MIPNGQRVWCRWPQYPSSLTSLAEGHNIKSAADNKRTRDVYYGSDLILPKHHGHISQRVYELKTQIFGDAYHSYLKKNNDPMGSQTCTHHDNSNFLTSANLEPDCNIRIIIPAMITFRRIELAVHIPSVTWAPASITLSCLLYEI